MGKSKRGPRKLPAVSMPPTRQVEYERNMAARASVASTASFTKPTRPKGRPAKTPMVEVSTNRREESANKVGSVVKVLVRSLKDSTKSMATQNNGFARNLKPDEIMAAVEHQGQLWFAVRFKNRKLPEMISQTDLKRCDQNLYLRFFANNIRYTHKETYERMQAEKHN